MKKSEKTLDEVNELIFNEADILSAKYGRKVLPMVFEFNDEWVIGYFKSPTRMQIMSTLGKQGQDPIFSGESLLNANILKEESDVRFLNDNQDFDRFNIGAFTKAYASAMQVSYDLSEKKTGK